MLYKDEALVLRTMRLGEADRIVTLVGKENGRIRAVVKGVRRTKSRFGARLEPFTHLSLVLWRGKSDLDTVTQAEVLQTYRPIREDLDRYSLGAVMLEACDRVIQEREHSGPLLDVLVHSLNRLSTDASPLVLAQFLLKLTAVAGFAPALDACAECDAPSSWFSPGQGGSVCPRCRSLDAEEVGPRTLELLSDLAALRPSSVLPGDGLSPSEVAVACRLARFYAEYHLERRLKSAAAAEALAHL